MAEKRYPFSMSRNGHNIELAYTAVKLEYMEMTGGDRKWSDKAAAYFETLRDLYARAIAEPVYWATGKEYGILKDASMWAVNYRDLLNKR